MYDNNWFPRGGLIFKINTHPHPVVDTKVNPLPLPCQKERKLQKQSDFPRDRNITLTNDNCQNYRGNHRKYACVGNVCDKVSDRF